MTRRVVVGSAGAVDPLGMDPCCVGLVLVVGARNADKAPIPHKDTDLPEDAGDGIGWACQTLGGRPGERSAPTSRSSRWAAPHLQIVAMAVTIGPTPRHAK